ncbi:E3 ubiquitin-protein ligase TRIM38-like [Sorex araneus]|uniref:E3 ubiquitin-protein ligase TRIM38-like n=1 Tax=Sorex araneus TaxID=42254 RepID=UPI0024336C97|nr:E3 ubiquitin-protein ligase TRIM38-like [Sorex araneus]
MASATALTIKEEATCFICLELMTEPVIIDCGHIYCRSCILKNLAIQKQQSPSGENLECPVCRAQFHRESIRPSKQLGNLIDTIKKMELEHLCEEHGEWLCLFCEDDEQLICWHCDKTPQHRGHNTVLAANAYQEYKQGVFKCDYCLKTNLNIQRHMKFATFHPARFCKTAVILDLLSTNFKLNQVVISGMVTVYTVVNFEESLTHLRKLAEQNKEWLGNIREQIKNFKSEMMEIKNDIKYDFKFFHMILYMEEDSYLWRLENEEEQVLKRLQDSEAQLEKQSQELNKHILELERKCQGSAQELLQDVRNTLDRISAMKLNAPEDVSLHIHSMPDVESFFCQLLKLFETDNVKLTLDLDTAHNNLYVDKDKNKAFGGRLQVKQDTTTRFKDSPCVLGCEAFTSGKYYFEISFKYYFENSSFREGSRWDVGVCLENVPRENDMRRDPESGFWAIRHCRDDDYIALTSPLTPLCLEDVSLIGVFVDYEAGLVSFYNVDTISHIFTFPKASFSGPVRPYFCIGEDTYLHIYHGYL